MRKLLFAFLVSSLLISCDYTRFPSSDSNGEEPIRRVLLYKFTGHLCNPCPAASVIAEDIRSDYPENVVVLTISPDLAPVCIPWDGEPGEQFTTDWRTPEGNFFQNIFDITSVPSGCVNGISFDDSYSLFSGSWREEIEALLYDERDITVSQKINYDFETRVADLETSVEFHNDLNGDYSLILATVEGHVVDWQSNGTAESPSDPAFDGGYIPNYEHKHVLRNHINGIEGEFIVQGEVSGSEIFDFQHSMLLSDQFLEDEISIVAYVYDNNSLEILDVVQTDLY